MIVGARFTWGHIPKTGGDALRAMVQRLGLDVAVTSAAQVIKHSAFGTHLDPGGNRVYLATIRRLPSWMLSVMMHRRAFGWFPPETAPADIRTTNVSEWLRSPMGSWADERLNLLTNHGAIGVDRFLRMESLTDDLLEFLRENDINTLPNPEARLLNFPKVNAVDYEHDFTAWFTPAEIHRLYERNPLWAEIEARVYEHEGVPA